MKRIFQKNINTPERYDQIYGENRLRIEHQDNETEAKKDFMASGIKDGMKVVELGCGNSGLLLRIKDKFPNCEVHGLDFSPLMVDWLRENTKGVEFLQGDALKTPYSDNYFDYVMAGELLEHVESPSSLVKEMVRICKDDGTIAISTPFVETSWRDPYAEHLWQFDRQDMVDLFSPYGHIEIKLFMGKGRHIVVTCNRKEIGSESPYRSFKELRESKKIIANELDGNFESILELGCQWGENLVAINQKFPGRKVKGIDINKNVLDDATQFVGEVELEYGDVNKLDIPDKSYDIVFTSALLCMITPKEIEHTLDEMIRIAKKKVMFIELHGLGNRFGYIGVSGRTICNYPKLLEERGLKYEMRKLKKEEWDVQPWATYGYLFTINL